MSSRVVTEQSERPFIAKTVRLLAVPIFAIWAVAAVASNVFVQQVDIVAKERAGPMIPVYAPSQRAMLHIGDKFHESTSTSIAMIVLETSDRRLSERDHQYYDDLVRRLERDHAHMQYVMDLWGKPITAAAAESLDGKSTYVLLRLAGDVGQMKANQSVEAARDIVAHDPPPQGLRVYVTGPAPLAKDTISVASMSLNDITIITIVLIIGMLLLVYRSVTTMLLPLLSVVIEMLIAKGLVAGLGTLGWIGLSSFAVNIVISLTLGAGTDYAIFLLGRYHEARHAGQSREDAYYTAYRGVTPVIVGSGLTIAGAGLCLSFARLNYFHTMGPAVAISMLSTIAAALTLAPAILSVGSLFELFDPKVQADARRYRRIGTCVVHWPVPILVASTAAVMAGAIFVPTYRVTYDDRIYQPKTTPANEGFAAADRHFPASKLFTEMLMIESDHDMRNSADFISLDRAAKSLIRLPGVAMVQSITRPLGRPLQHATLPYLFTTQGSGNGQQLPFTKANNANTEEQAKIMAESIAVLKQTVTLTQNLSAELHTTVLTLEDMEQVARTMNEQISNLDDFMRPLRSYFHWEPHCLQIPVCWAFRSLFDALDGIDQLADDIKGAVGSLQVVDKLLRQMVSGLKAMTEQQEGLRAVIVNTYGALDLQAAQTGQTFDDMINVGLDFDRSRSDDFFYISHEAFDNPDLKIGMQLMMSPDGRAARFLITHKGNALGLEGIDHVERFPEAVNAALKETSVAGAKVYIGGTGSNDQDIKTYDTADLETMAMAAFALIFLIMMILTRSLIAPLVIVGTVAFSFAGALGLATLIWQHVIGLPLHWLVLPLCFIILVAVGSDYNLLLIARVKQEQAAGLNTGLIRALSSTGSVVTSAGLVFAFTMLAMLSSDLKTIGQVGSTVCIGLLLDTLVVRSFIVPSIVRLLGAWFWWPSRSPVRARDPRSRHIATGDSP